MKIRAASCPSCGGGVEFRVSTSLVTVCPYCGCVVARGDKAVEDHGKVADLIDTNSPIVLGVSGHWHRHRFDVIGRVQYKHPAGGVWDEWYLAFGNDSWAWLAEAQGKRYITFEKKLKSGVKVPAHDSLTPGDSITLGSRGEFTVGEVGVAQTGSAQGEIPWSFVPKKDHKFVDLHTEGKGFATIDYNGETPRLFLGQEVTLEELDITTGGWGGSFEEPTHHVTALSLNCPSCGGALELQAPDKTERVGCPHCGSLLDCAQGKLSYFQTLNAKRVRPQIPLGTLGKICGVEYMVIGFMERFAMYAGRTFPWTEYLLYDRKSGEFRWLVNNKNHWSFVEPVSPNEIKERTKALTYKNNTFKLYDRGTAYVRYVVGEFYWKVTAGDSVETADYIAPPRMMSRERSGSGAHQELNFSLGTYMTVEEVEQIFKQKDLKRSLGVGPIQPAPNTRGVFQLWAIFIMVILVEWVVLGKVFSKNGDGGFLLLMLGLLSVLPILSILYLWNFDVQRWSESDYSPYSSE